MTDLIKLRKKIKDKKPDFVRQEAHKRKRLSKKWRAPKGMHSKMRRKERSKRKQPSVGYSSPKKVRGLTRQGFKPILVKNLNDIEKIKENEIVIISKTLGLRKKLLLLEKIKQNKIKVENVKDIDLFIKKAKENSEQKKKKRTEKKKAKEEKKPKEKTKEKKETPEEKEKREKEEKRKVLEKK